MTPLGGEVASPPGMGLAWACSTRGTSISRSRAPSCSRGGRATAALRPLLTRSYAAVSGDDVDATISYRQRASIKNEATAGEGGCPAGQRPEGGEPVCPPGPARPGPAGGAGPVRADELERGVCLVGPHRDDLELGIGDLPARGYASHGESWSMALALRLAGYRAAPRGRRRPGPAARRRLRRTGRRAAGTGWPAWWPARSRSWSPPRFPRMFRRPCGGHGFPLRRVR